MGGQFSSFLFELLQSHINRGSPDGRGTATKSTNPILDRGGVAVQHNDVVKGNAQFIGRNLRKSCFLALAMGRGAGIDGDFSGGLYPYGCTLPAPSGHS